jgi:hypothetical protein
VEMKKSYATYGQCCGSGMFIPDPAFLVIPDPGSGSRILHEKREVQNKFNFFLPDQMITAVNVHTKYNFSSFSIFFK